MSDQPSPPSGKRSNYDPIVEKGSVTDLSPAPFKAMQSLTVKAAERRQSIYDRRSEIAGIVKRCDDELIWDKIQARDVPAEIIEFVCDGLEKRVPARQIMRMIGIPTANDKRWKKIMAAIRSGVKIDVAALAQKWVYQNEVIADRIQDLTEAMLDEIEEKGLLTTPEGENEVYGLSKNILAAVDTLGKLRAVTAKAFKDLGIIDPPEMAKGHGGVTIKVINNVPLPARETINSHNEARLRKAQEIITTAQSRRLEGPPEGEPVGE